jgi:hypothetical protein
MDPLNILALAIRFIMVVVYLYIFNYFYHGYKKSKTEEYRNDFFLGNAMFFGAVSFLSLMYASYDLYKAFIPNHFMINDPFPWKPDNLEGLIKEISYQVNPMFITFYFILALILAAQMFPLEKVMGKEKTPISKTIIIMGSFNLLLFIPTLSYTWLSVITVPLAFLAMALGIIVNIVVNMVIAKKSTGQLRNQSLYGVFAFLLFAAGFAMALESSWLRVFGATYTIEAIVGSVIQFISVILYRKTYQLPESEDRKKEEERMFFHRALVGDFKDNEVLYFFVISMVIVFVYLLIALALYPPENNYSIMKDTISFLGSSDLDNNPEGWIFFSISVVFLSIIFVPIALFQYKKFKELDRVGAFFLVLFLIIGAIGLCLLGFFPDNGGESFIQDVKAGEIHNKVALLAIGGVALGILSAFFLLIKDHIPLFKGKKRYPFKVIIIPTLIFLLLVGLVAYFLLKWDAICTEHCWPGPGVYSFPMWEWIVFIMLIIMEGVILWILNTQRIPDETE